MYQFFVEPAQINVTDKSVIIIGNDVNHIKNVLRMRPGEEISEAACMYGWLAARGVPPERIILEEQADNTRENIGYSLALLSERGIDAGDGVAVVSSGYHLCRASMYMPGNMVPVAARMPARYLPLEVNYYIREAFGIAAELFF